MTGRYFPEAGLFGTSRSPATKGACRHCAHWLAWTAGGSHAVCGEGERPIVIANPKSGCAFWERGDPGVDDDLGDPPREPEPNPYL